MAKSSNVFRTETENQGPMHPGTSPLGITQAQSRTLLLSPSIRATLKGKILAFPSLGHLVPWPFCRASIRATCLGRVESGPTNGLSAHIGEIGRNNPE